MDLRLVFCHFLTVYQFGIDGNDTKLVLVIYTKMVAGAMTIRDPQIHIRLEQSVKDFLQRRAKQQERTMGAHITFLLRQEMEKEKASDPAVGSKSDASNQ
ncbi:hypothetical protein HKD21_10325 [Gluconobacter cerevisiae]|uniref:Uncharacterized protein n=1 Tax=Gluconobacter cerevisiae TaxID=1379734 RepID=A0ABR9YEY9_9PROT|nr:hypothetical protein [Gluconobacter cerevisiae]MBF0877240.1 hypothetical protein [Gluconobacter cerevisiae]